MKKTEAGMEDGSDGISSTAVLPSSTVKNGEVMANFPDVDCDADNETKKNNISSPVKVNGDSNLENSKSEDESDSSDCGALVIDETVRPQKSKKPKSTKPKSGGFKGFKKSNITDAFVHTNPYFAESIFDLLEKSQEKKQDDSNAKEGGAKKINCKNHVKNQVEKKAKANPKLREYAQYLGLQPTVQFKCSKCSRSGFPSLASLNEHLIQCNDSVPVTDSAAVNVSSTPSTNIRVTRKVFLCSACGTYYENWNLFLHMREVHKRYICLYCLGMFSHPDKLAVHIVSKHNCVPNHISTLDEFYSLHGEPCFLMCCECQRGFTERDNFFEHMCIDSSGKANAVKNLNQRQAARQNNRVQKTKSVEHVTADSITNDSDDISADCAANDATPPAGIIPPDTVQADNETDNAQRVPGIQTSDNNLISKCDTNEKSENLEDTFLESTGSQLQADCQKVAKESDTLDSDIREAELESSDDEQKLEDCDNLADDTTKKSDYDSVQSENNYEENVTVAENTSPAESETRMEQSAEEETRSFDEEMNVSDQEHSDPDILNDSFDMNVLEENETDPKSDAEEKVNSILSGNEEENRRVPKVTLRLPKTFEDFQSDKEEEDVPAYESDDSEKLTMEVDQTENTEDDCTKHNETVSCGNSDFQVAGPDVSIVDLELEQPLDKFGIKFLLQKCLRSTVATCAYCNHARRICVNGRQLGLHAIAEHRFSAIVNSITAEELIPESFVARIKDGLPELENVHFNLESNTSEEAITFSHVFECFQCRYSTTVHKELYLHNRKMHAKSILLCIMCKSNFYSYSELICHLCPGLYELDNDVHFRCCMCVSDEFPSAFRLMVHLRKKHHACDVCLELCHNQSKLSNHVWKHKLHHLCYRCGIAYRNKPDITKHLFWKHGTESVLCKKCLQKKWPHVYHFCIPPTTFSCEECNFTFTRAVSLMVHKRLHSDLKPHACTEEDCAERFISKKLLLKHEFKHREPVEEAAKPDAENTQESENLETAPPAENAEEDKTPKEANEVDEKADKTKPKVDVYDLPELNLSESDSSDTEDEAQKNATEAAANITDVDGNNQNDLKDSAELELEKPVPVLETIWDDFRNYQAKLQNNSTDFGGTKEAPPEETPSLDVILKDHDYCVVTSTDNEAASASKPDNVEMSVDHDYCFGGPSSEGKKTEGAPKKKTNGSSSSNSSSDSDSSSCTCGSNCSCSSSSGSSSSSSDSSESDSSTSEGRRRQQQRRERRKQKSKTKKGSEAAPVDVVATDNNQAVTFEVPIQESDLETTESDTDEDFYDEQPQKLANKLLAEKKNQLLQMAAIGPYINGSIMDGSRPPTPSLPEESKPKKKSKSKKRKKKNKSSKYESENPNINIPVDSYPLVSPLTLSLSKNSPITTPMYNSPNSSSILLPNVNLPTINQSFSSLNENDSSLRASKRRRVPNKFYGYSSDEEQDKIPQPPVYKWRKVDLPSPKSPLVVPPITIKTVQTPHIPIPQTVEPISIRTTATSGELRVQQSRPQLPPIAKIRSVVPQQELESGTESNESSSEEEQPPPAKEQPALYCYCRCPYDEVSEMIGCDASDCAIEWFHFECVGIMVPPKGQWFCPDCRKKKQQRREMLQNQL